MRWLALILAATSCAAFAQEPAPAEPDFDSLGGNRILLERAKAFEPEKQVTVVQNRAVQRRHRIELAPEISGIMGGEAYLRTRSIGLNAYYHFTPRVALGFKFNYPFNQLSPEGNAQVDLARKDFEKDPENPSVPFPKLDYSTTEWLGLVNWFPLYGKFSVLDRKVIHFDFYAVGGAGRTQLNSGWKNTYTAGGGMGLWLTNHFSTRFEARWQTYTGQYYSGPRRLDLTVASLQMGWLL